MILLVSKSILPWTSGSSIITENLSKNFRREELVVLGEKSLFSIEDKPNRDVNFEYIRTGLSIWKGRGKRFVNLFRWLLFPYLCLRIRSIVLKYHVTKVIGTFPDNYYLLASALVSKILKIDFYAYFHNTYIENRLGLDHTIGVWIQNKVFNNVEKVFVMSDGLERYYQKTYPDVQFVTLRHSYLGDIFPQKLNITPNPSFVLFGNFNFSNFDATNYFLSHINDLFPESTINVFSQLPLKMMNYKGIKTDKLIHHGVVSDDELIWRLREFDFVVLTHGFEGNYSNVEYKTIFPTRTIPALRSGMPIICLAPEESYFHSFCEQYEFSFLIGSKSLDGLPKNLSSFVLDKLKQKEKVESAAKAAMIFNGNQIKETLIHELSDER